MAPELFLLDNGFSGPIGGPSTKSDVYSLAMTSFAVRSFSAVNRPNA